MSLSQTELHPEDPDRLPPARRRRAHRLLAPLDEDERAAFLDEVAHRASPSFDFFLFSLLAGVVIGTGLLFDAPAVLLLGALLAPLMAPVAGVALGMVIGSGAFFLRSLVGQLIGGALVSAGGAALGLLGRYWLPADLSLAHYHAQLSLANFLLLAVGAVFTVATLVDGDRNPALPSVALAYALYLPLASGGFGLASGVPHLWPDGVVIFVVYLAWGAMFGALTLALLGFRPQTLFGYTLGGAVALFGVIIMIGISGAGAVFGGRIGLPTPIPSTTATITPSPSLTLTPLPPTGTSTPTRTSTVTPTITRSPTPTATPVYAVVQAIEASGAVLRSEPGGPIVQSYMNGALMQVLPETQELDGVLWVRVIAPDGKTGWMVQSLLLAVTPTPTP